MSKGKPYLNYLPLSPQEWIAIEESYYTSCRYCRHSFGSRFALSTMKWHIETAHPEKVKWRIKK